MKDSENDSSEERVRRRYDPDYTDATEAPAWCSRTAGGCPTYTTLPRFNKTASSLCSSPIYGSHSDHLLRILSLRRSKDRACRWLIVCCLLQLLALALTCRFLFVFSTVSRTSLRMKSKATDLCTLLWWISQVMPT